MAWAAVAAIALAVLLPVAGGSAVKASSAVTYRDSFNYGAPAAPQAIVPPELDVQIHIRASGDTMTPMFAQHGANCGAPPLIHPIVNLTDAVFACKNHLMTALNDVGYGEVVLTPPALVDFSAGTATIKFDVSTLQLNPSNWVAIWLTPYADNLAHPDVQGSPSNALSFAVTSSGLDATSPGDILQRVNGGARTKISTQAGSLPLSQAVPPSGATRTTYEIDVSTTHIRYGLPTVGTGNWWIDTNIAPLSFNQAVMQIVQYSYNPDKHCGSCTSNDTWHWSNLSISPAIPFTILNGAERSIHAGVNTTVHFPAPAPANSMLRFSGIGNQGGPNGYFVSYDGGATWVSAAMQANQGNHSEIFTTYWTPVPAGTTTVMFRGTNWWGGAWWVRDPAIWSDGQPVGGQTGGGSTGGGTTGGGTTGGGTTGGGTTGGGTTGGGTGGGTTGGGTTGGGSGSKEGGTTGGGTTGGGTTGGGTTSGGSGSKEGGSGSKSGSSAPKAGGATGATSVPASVSSAPQSLLIKLDAVLNPRQDPTVNVILILLAAGLLFAIFRVIRG
jgi:hypothetical protein